MTSVWIDFSRHDFNASTNTGYFVKAIDSNNRGRESYSLRERPLRTSQSNEPKLTGWCGDTNNVSRHACGAWQIVQTNRAGNRARIVKLDGEALVVFLRGDGHPELVPGPLASLSESIGMGEEDGAEEAVNIHKVYVSHDASVLRTALAQDNVAWSKATADAKAHALRGITDETKVAAYYRAYERSARATAARLLKSANVTDEQIETLAVKASRAGDDEQFHLCWRAVGGDAAARAECVRVILDAKAQSPS